MRYRVDNVTGCWNWGDGRVERPRLMFDGAKIRVYRLAYELLVGPIPPGHDVHHTCGNARCINPDHLEAVVRADHAERHREFALKATHCKYGHPWDETNTYFFINAGGNLQRRCRACHATHEKERQRKIRRQRSTAHL